MERIVKGIWIPMDLWKDTGLNWNEKILLMEIDSFTSAGKDCYISNEYIAEFLNVSVRWARKYMSHLIDAGYVKVVRFDGRKRYVEAERKFQAERSECSGQGGAIAPHTDINYLYKEKDTIRKPAFNFKSSLLSLGVSEDVADAWMTVRRNKRATNTEIAFKRIQAEIQKSGKTANECITIAVENSWQGFKAEWLEPKPQRQGAPKRRETVFEHNLRAIDAVLGTDMHGQYYGRRDTDEQ